MSEPSKRASNLEVAAAFGLLYVVTQFTIVCVFAILATPDLVDVVIRNHLTLFVVLTGVISFLITSGIVGHALKSRDKAPEGSE